MKEGKIINILGRRGQGKTYLAYALFDSSKKSSVFINPRLTPKFYEDKYKVIKSLYDFSDIEDQYKFKLIVTFNNDLEYFTFFEILKNIKNATVYFDEVSLWTNKNRINSSLEYLVSYTRTQNLNLIFIARRPQELNPLLMSQADLLIIFNTQNLNDLKYLNTSYTGDFSGLKDLAKHEFLLYGDLTALSYL